MAAGRREQRLEQPLLLRVRVRVRGRGRGRVRVRVGVRDASADQVGDAQARLGRYRGDIGEI